MCEPHTAAVARWYGRTRADLASATWCVTKFASALSIKQRTGQLDAMQAHDAWRRFGLLTVNDLALLPLAAAGFHRAAVDTDEAMNLRIAKWGSSLALRIPSAIARQLGLHAGDTVRVQVPARGVLSIGPTGWSRAAFGPDATGQPGPATRRPGGRRGPRRSQLWQIARRR